MNDLITTRLRTLLPVETAPRHAEVEQGAHDDEDDDELMPVVRRWLGVGEWSNPPGTPAHPFTGLLA